MQREKFKLAELAELAEEKHIYKLLIIPKFISEKCIGGLINYLTLKIYYFYQFVNINRVGYVNICESRNTETKNTFVLICCIIFL